MPKVTGPLFSLKAQGQFAKSLIFKRGGIVVNYFKPRNPNTPAQQAQREIFKDLYTMGLTKEQADLLYAAIAHLHDDRYSQLGHEHDHGALTGLADDDHTQYFNQTRGDARYSQIGHGHNDLYSLLTHHHNSSYIPDAPSDGKNYVRKNAAWVEAAAASSPDVVLIARQELSSAQATIDFQNIPSTYKHLRVHYSLRSTRTPQASDIVTLKVNNDAASGSYESMLYYWYYSNTWGNTNASVSTLAWMTYATAAGALANSFGSGFIEIPEYAKTDRLKIMQTRGGMLQSITIHPEIYDGMAVWRSTAAIDRLTFGLNIGPNFAAGCVVSLYGVN